MLSASPTDIMKIVNDVSVVVPASMQLMTPYVLREQKDWFEDEIKFLRTFIKPGMKVIDIGANYGLYSLALAKIIKGEGNIWAFEPTSFSAGCLRQSIEENGFTNIQVIQAGLSSSIGKAKLYTDPNSELNSLSKGTTSGNYYETVLLWTLDYCFKKFSTDGGPENHSRSWTCL